MLVPVILSGFLAKKYGKRFELAVESPREAVRALCSQLPGFEHDILGHQAGFRIWLDREQLPDATSLDRNTGARPIRIVPVVAGAKDGTLGIILGVVLIVVAPYLPTGYGIVAGTYTSIGVSLILGGVAQMLAPTPKTAQLASNQSNLLFSGGVNTIGQGNAVPICYGRMRIGSQVISAGIESVQLPNTGLTSAPGFAAMGGGGK